MTKRIRYWLPFPGLTILVVAYAALVARADVPLEVLSPVVGDLEVVSSVEQCSNTKWCFNQHQTGAHAPSGGVGQADDTFAWDANLNFPAFDSDAGRVVLAVASGIVAQSYGSRINAGGSFGQVLIEHTTADGTMWWSGYLHMTDIQVTPGQIVTQETVLGFVSNDGVPDGNDHLHFVVYRGENTLGSLVSFDPNIVPRFSESPIDIYFLVDLSGSFADDLPNFKAQAPGIISTLKASNPNTRFGLGKYEDYPILPFGFAPSGDKAYERLIDLTFDTDLLLDIVAGLFTRNGADFPQSQLVALFQAATGAGQDLSGVGFPNASIPSGQQANFRDGATKLFLLWTDASFHNPGDTGTIPYPGPSFEETVNAILSLDPPKVIGISSGLSGIADLQRIAEATDSLAPPGGVDCDADGVIDIAEGEPLVCSIAPSGEGIGEAVIAIVGAATAEIEVTIDIKPGSEPNSINPANSGLIPVAILTTDNFDALTVSPITVRFGVGEASIAHPSGHLEDVDSDGDLDLVLHFRTQQSGIQCGDTSASLTGETFDGQSIQGSDSVATVGCG